MSETSQYGELATQLVVESRRSTQTATLLKYNDVLVRSLIREQRDLEKAASTLALQDGPPAPALIVLETAINRNKRCLLAYHTHRTDFLRSMYWSLGGALPHILGNQELRGRLSPHEVDFLREYHKSIMEFRSDFVGDEMDVMAGVSDVPRELNVMVRVVRECGEIRTEMGVIDFRQGERHMVRRADVEHLIVQGYLEEV